MARKPRPAPVEPGVAAAVGRSQGSSKVEGISGVSLEHEIWRTVSRQLVGLQRAQAKANERRRAESATAVEACLALANELRARHPEWTNGDVVGWVVKQMGLPERTVRRYLAKATTWKEATLK
jgi:hypothetical protein